MLPRELWAAAGEEQEQRREADPWEDVAALGQGRMVSMQGRGAPPLQRDLVNKHLAFPIDRQKNSKT